ncbi:DEAD/DEAH box helicase [Acidilutibacter cellobiosedens]|nr:DEAD/DEAH box helicase [Acidilutibacter cellobiosedens]
MNGYDLLRKEIRQYIYDEDWDSLRGIQEASIKHVHDTENNLILAAPTASGKTEAAFLPAINSIKDWASGLKIVYISPLIALINDQFRRIYELCGYMDIPVTSWHGEASRAKKNKLLKKPRGILLITPESIEAMLSLRPGEAKGLFRGTEWIIVDEIHSFLENNRGIQLRSLIERIELYMEKEPRFIGMSATLNREDYKKVKNFFISDRVTDVLLDSSQNPLEATKSYYKSNMKRESREALEEIYDYSQRESMLIFPNSRGEVERLAVGLSKLGRQRGSDTRYFAHHSSVSKDMRLNAEEFAKSSRGKLFTICCTSTLELGMDIGSVDSIVQYNAPHSVASLAQRLGRSGRTTRKNILHFIATDEWSLLQGLAALSFYEEGLVDRFDYIIKPYDVLAHQIISILLENTGMPVKNLKNINKNFRCWQDIEDDEYFELLEYLIKRNYIEILENEAITGIETEKLLRGSDFFTHFETENNFSVYNSQRKIGEIPLSPGVQTGVNIFLAAQIWKITDIELKSKKIYVNRAVDGNPPIFLGSGANITNEIRNRMKVILENENYWIYYNENIREVLSKLSKENLRYEKFRWVEKNDKFGLRTFQGTKINRTLQLLLNMLDDRANYKLDDRETFISGPNIRKDINRVIERKFTEDEIFLYLRDNPGIVESYLSSNKYRMLLPDNLKIKYVINNKLDLEGVKSYLTYSGK